MELLEQQSLLSQHQALTLIERAKMLVPHSQRQPILRGMLSLPKFQSPKSLKLIILRLLSELPVTLKTLRDPELLWSLLIAMLIGSNSNMLKVGT